VSVVFTPGVVLSVRRVEACPVDDVTLVGGDTEPPLGVHVTVIPDTGLPY
jgi:hypothetical protein